MDNQHRQIKGYRELSQADIDLMNKVKEQGKTLQALITEIRITMAMRAEEAAKARDSAEIARLHDSDWRRWAAMAQTDFQTGLMKLTRAVAQPETF
jgi:hypothetical protein